MFDAIEQNSEALVAIKGIYRIAQKEMQNGSATNKQEAVPHASKVDSKLLYITQDEQPLLGSNVDAEESEEQAAAAEAAARPITERHEDTLTQQGLQR